ncbi:MAG TPA: hypothetical protein EYG24_03880 [Methylococcales bacterium]|jgi:hypothetical protein|nr:hypothetical protein [Methylococcales bacterium]
MKESQCSVCQQVFSCEYNAGKGKSCWCSQLPLMMTVDSVADCLCYDCLITVLGARIKTLLLGKSCPESLAIAKQYPTDTWIENIDYTVENGKCIFSAWYHLKRGHCCNNGCRYCPY